MCVNLQEDHANKMYGVIGSNAATVGVPTSWAGKGEVMTAFVTAPKEARMHFEAFSFGSIRIDGVTHAHDVVIDHGRVRGRDKKPSKRYREAFGHTPLSIVEKIPWKCRRLVIGTGMGALPVMEEVKQEAKTRDVELLILPTAEAIAELEAHPKGANAILHVTC